MSDYEPLATGVVETVDGSTGEIVPLEGLRIDLPGRFTPTSWELPPELTFAQWSALGQALQAMGRSMLWWLGDWALYGDGKWRQLFVQAVDEGRINAESAKVARWVAERFPPVMRITSQSFSHHRVVAGEELDDALHLLRLAQAECLSSRELAAIVAKRKQAKLLEAPQASSETCTVDDLHALIKAGKRFGTIYADPPWEYDNQGTRAATSNHYGGMSVEELCDLPIGELAEKDAQLHLWTTNGFLFECPKIFEAWGFEFRSSFIWVKPQIGIGNYWRNAHEILLTAVRGDAKRFRNKDLRSWLVCDRGKHSAKPEQVRSYIQRASPAPFLELFGRRQAQGWTVWGNEVERSLFFADPGEVPAPDEDGEQLDMLPEVIAA